MHESKITQCVGVWLAVAVGFASLSCSARGYPSYPPSADLVRVAPYDQAITGSGNWGAGTGNTFREFLTVGQRYRIRQNGAIARCRLYTATTNQLTGFYLTVWRKDGSTYDRVGSSGNLCSSLVSGEIATIDLDVPIPVQEGDYYGYRLESTTPNGYNFFARTGVAGVTSYYVNNTNPSQVDFDWTSGSLLVGAVLPIELLMGAPQVAFIGDSIIAGHPAHYSFIETVATTAIESTIERQFANLTGYTYQNLGVGSQTTAGIVARFADDLLGVKPRLAIIEGGVNDLATGVSKANYLANMNGMLAAAQADINITTVAVLKILPWSNGTLTQMQAWNEWNAALVATASNYAKAIVVDASSYVGQFRTGGDPSNLWNIQAIYNADGVHFNQAGHAQIAQAIADALLLAGPVLVINTLPYAESFEEYAEGERPTVAQGWTISTTGKTQVIGDESILRKLTNDYPWPLPLRAPHTKVLKLGMEAINNAVDSKVETSVITDFMLLPIRSSEMPAPELLEGMHLSVAFNAEGRIAVLHAATEDGVSFSTEWHVLANSPVVASEDWVRITIVQDYVTKRFQVRLHGLDALTDIKGWNKGGDKRPGSWFHMVNRTDARMTIFEVHGDGYLDDLWIRAYLGEGSLMSIK